MVVVPVVNADGFEKSVNDGLLVDLREVDGGGTVSVLGTPANTYKRKSCAVEGLETTPPLFCDAAKSPGGYGIGVGTSSSVGSTHTSNASSTYTVAAPVGLSETLTTTKSSYKAGEVVSITARVMKGSVAVSGASVSFVALKPNKVNTIELRGTTNSNGYVTVSFKSGTGSSSIGTYQVSSTATVGNDTAKATTSFSVYK